jgi:hypothetical protein
MGNDRELAERRTLVRWGGWLCVVAGLTGAASGIALATVDPVVPKEAWSYPQSSGAFVATQIWFAVQHLGLLAGLVALGWAGAAGRRRSARIGGRAAVIGMVALTITELLAATAADLTTDDAWVMALGALYGLVSLVIGVGLVIEGAGVLRGGVWSGWRRWVPLSLGIWVFVPMMPLMSMSFVGARLAITGWMLLFALLGAVLAGTATTTTNEGQPGSRPDIALSHP